MSQLVYKDDDVEKRHHDQDIEEGSHEGVRAGKVVPELQQTRWHLPLNCFRDALILEPQLTSGPPDSATGL